MTLTELNDCIDKRFPILCTKEEYLNSFREEMASQLEAEEGSRSAKESFLIEQMAALDAMYVRVD